MVTYAPVSGDLVKVTFKKQLGNYQWWKHEMTAIYLSSNPAAGEHHFSLRPHFGTTQIKTDQIMDIELVKTRGELSAMGLSARSVGLGRLVSKGSRQLSRLPKSE
jgi:hypothetical protein